MRSRLADLGWKGQYRTNLKIAPWVETHGEKWSTKVLGFWRFEPLQPYQLRAMPYLQNKKSDFRTIPLQVLIIENLDVRQIGLEAPELVIVREFSALTLKRFG